MFRTEGAPYKPLPTSINPNVLSKMEVILSGRWTVDDVLEMGVDETSTAASVGSGPAKGLGGVYREPNLEKMKKAYEEYLHRVSKEHSPKALREYVESSLPGTTDLILRLQDAMIRNLAKYLREGTAA